VNNAGSIDPLTAASLAQHYGIRIYTIGVGSRGAVPMPIKRQNAFTGEIETTYQLVRADLDEESLSEIARRTGGAYFRATDARSMSDILHRIDQLEKTRLNAPRNEKVDELYVRPLRYALMLLALALLAGETVWEKVAA